MCCVFILGKSKHYVPCFYKCKCFFCFSCREQSSLMCPQTSCTCSECRRCVIMTCAVISAKHCSSEVAAHHLYFEIISTNPKQEIGFWNSCCLILFSSEYNKNIWRVSYCEDWDGEWRFFHVSDIHVALLANYLSSYPLPVSPSPQFLQHPLQTWLQ